MGWINTKSGGECFPPLTINKKGTDSLFLRERSTTVFFLRPLSFFKFRRKMEYMSTWHVQHSTYNSSEYQAIAIVRSMWSTEKHNNLNEGLTNSSTAQGINSLSDLPIPWQPEPSAKLWYHLGTLTRPKHICLPCSQGSRERTLAIQHIHSVTILERHFSDYIKVRQVHFGRQFAERMSKSPSCSPKQILYDGYFQNLYIMIDALD